MRTLLIATVTLAFTIPAFAGEHHVTGHGATDAAAKADAMKQAAAMCEKEHHGHVPHVTKSEVHNKGADHAVDITFDCQAH